MASPASTLEVRPKTVPGKGTSPDVVTVSIAEASQLCNCSDDTIRRRANDGKLRGAYREGVGQSAQWRIPVIALVEAGLCDVEVLEQLDERLNPNIARLANQIVDLRAELVSERVQREAAERMFAEAYAEVQYLRDLSKQLVALSAKSSQERRVD